MSISLWYEYLFLPYSKGQRSVYGFTGCPGNKCELRGVCWVSDTAAGVCSVLYLALNFHHPPLPAAQHSHLFHLHTQTVHT